MTERKLPFGLGRFLGKNKQRTETATSLPELTKRDDLFRPEETIVSFYTASADIEEKIRQQLTEQFPADPDKVNRILEQIRKSREKRQAG